MNMDFTNIYKPTELTKIYNEISSDSQYQKDMQKYMDFGYAQGFIQAIKFQTKENQDFIMNEIKESSKDSNTEKYIIRLWEECKREEI